jgi:hypothetical protein
MTDNYQPLTTRWFSLATDVARTSFKGMLALQERTRDVTENLLKQVEEFKEPGEVLVTEITREAHRVRLLVDETLERTRAFRDGKPFVPRILSSPDAKEVRELPAPGPSQTSISED